MKSFLALSALVLSGSFSIPAYNPQAEKPVNMGDVDVWSGLSTPVKHERAGPREAAKHCLALNAYHEARGEGFPGQVAVNQVALRRAGLDFKRVCAEIYKPGQFSWTSTKSGTRPTGAAWSWAMAAAEESLKWAAHPEKFNDYSHKATYFHATNVNPYWNRGLELVAMIGEHRFYR